MGDEGLEPSTTGLRVRCSTIELVTRAVSYYSNFRLNFGVFTYSAAFIRTSTPSVAEVRVKGELAYRACDAASVAKADRIREIKSSKLPQQLATTPSLRRSPAPSINPSEVSRIV